MRSLLLATFLLTAPAVAQPSMSLPRGDWHGTGLQVGPDGVQSTWTVDLSLTDKQSEISYPSLACRGVLHRITSSPSRVTFREEITEGDCINAGIISVTFENGRVFWFWTKPGLNADASAVLYPSGPIA